MDQVGGESEIDWANLEECLAGKEAVGKKGRTDMRDEFREEAINLGGGGGWTGDICLCDGELL